MRSCILMLAAGIALAWPAQAGDGWRVVDTAGAVRFGGPGVMPVAVTRDFELPADSWVETSDGGRAILLRGQETVIVEPNSRVQLPNGEVNGNTQVLQTLGTAIYKVGKQQKPHFQVDTPYLAAVVKGTAFTVSVEDGAASVSVSEGLVQVKTPDESDIEFVRPGFTAQISRDNSNEISIEPTPPKNDEDKKDQPVEKPGKTDDSNVQTISIIQPIGDVTIDVKDVSEGLVLDDVSLSDSTVKDAGGLTGIDERAPTDGGDTGKEDDSTGGLGVGIDDSPGHEADGVGETIDLESSDSSGSGNGNAYGLNGGNGNGNAYGLDNSGQGGSDISDMLPPRETLSED